MDFGGQERFVSRLSEMLQDTYDIYVVVFDASEVNYKVYGKILNIDLADFSSKTFVRRVRKIIIRRKRLNDFLKTYKPIVCMSFGEGANVVNLLCRRRGTRVFVSVRGFVSAERMTKRVVDRLLYPLSDEVICVSKGIEQKLRNEFPRLKDKLSVLYNGYDCDEIYNLSLQTGDCLSMEKEGPVLVSVGTLRPEKGYWHLIKALAILKAKYNNIKLYIIGADYQDYGKKLNALIDNFKLNDTISMIPFVENPYKYISSSSIYVLSSVREGFPNALVEAMACGKPVIAADCLTGPREILSEDSFDKCAKDIEYADYGILVPRLSEKEDYSCNIEDGERKLAEAIMILLNDNRIYTDYADRARKRAREFSYEACKSNLINKFRQQ